MSGARVRFSGDATDLVRAQEEVARGAKKMEDAIAATGREARRLERIASKAFHESATEQEKAERKARDLNKAWKEGYLSTEIYERQIKKLNASLDQTGEKQKRLPAQSSKMVESVVQMAGAYIGISETIGVINRGYDTWLSNQRKIAQEANKAALDVVAFAALQDDSSIIRQRTMQAVQAGAGVASSGQALNLVQSMQSAFGWDKGLAVSKDVFRTVQAGVPIDVATELAQSAGAQGQDPSRFVRAAFAAGQVSSKDPGVVGRAAKALPEFEDKDFGWLVAAQLSGNYSGELATYTRNAAASLSSVSTLKDTFDKLGVGKGATREQRLRALAAAGLDTSEELVNAGLSERSQAAGLADLVSAVSSGSFDKMSTQFRGLMSNPNLITDKRAMIESGLAETELQRILAELDSAITSRREFGPGAIDALKESVFDRLLITEFQKRGIPNIGPFGGALYEDGEVNRASMYTLAGANNAARAFGVGDARLQEAITAAMDRLERTMSRLADQNAITVTTQEK